MAFADFDLKVNLASTVTVLTGANGGLGRSISDCFALSGSSLLLTDSNNELVAFANELREKYSVRVESLVVDLLNSDSVQRIVDYCSLKFGKVDILINNAGTGVEHTLRDLRPADWDLIMTVNLKVPFMLSQAIANKFMIPAGSGIIINMASQAGLVALDNQAAYCISKAGLMSLTRSCAYEWGVHGITVPAWRLQ